MLVALSTVGINAHKDSRFIKSGNSALDALCAFYVGGGFAHMANGGANSMATEQAAYALCAYDRFLYAASEDAASVGAAVGLPVGFGVGLSVGSAGRESASAQGSDRTKSGSRVFDVVIAAAAVCLLGTAAYFVIKKRNRRQ